MQIQGKVIISGQIKAITGLHIGGASTGLEIGGVDKMVVRNPLNNQPYIPGSSLKGKLRSLLERAGGFANDNQRVWVKRGEVSMHLCNNPGCYLCVIFGRNNARNFMPVQQGKPNFEINKTTPTRLIVRDGKLVVASLQNAQTDLPYTEIKWEVGIDRITSAANPRQMERVPAGAAFDFEMVYTVYHQKDRENLRRLFEAMQLLEHDYLGGQGSRGSGQVEFKELKVNWHPRDFYETGQHASADQGINGAHANVSALLNNFGDVQRHLEGQTPAMSPAPGEAPTPAVMEASETANADDAVPPQPE